MPRLPPFFSPFGGVLALLPRTPRALAATATSSSTNLTRLLSVPAGLEALYGKLTGGTTTSNCAHVLDKRGGGYTANGDSTAETHYCRDAATPT